MDFDVIGSSGIDAARARRLAVGYAVGVLICAATLGVAASVTASVAPPPEEEELVDVKLSASAAAEEKAPEPEPEAPKAPEPAPVAPRGRAQLAAPTAIPTTAPAEGDSKDAPATGKDDPYGDGKGGVPGGSYTGTPGGTGTGAPPPPPPPPAPPPPPPPPPKPSGPTQLSEDMIPAVGVSTPRPSIGDAAVNAVLAAAGLEEITVIVKYVITETGDVTNVTIARGHPSLDAQILATVRSWKYKPATTQDGKPVSVSKVAKFRFKLKT